MTEVATELVPYSTATQLAEAYSREVSRILQLREELLDSAAALSEAFRGESESLVRDAFSVRVLVAEEDTEEGIRQALKQVAWRVIFSKTGIRKVMSVARRKEMDSVLWASPGDPRVAELPEISAEAIVDMVSGMAASVEDFLEEAIQEVYNFLKPGREDPYRTNVANRWKLSRKVIISGGVEKCAWRESFSVRYSMSAVLEALSRVFSLLDGKGIGASYYGELADAVETCTAQAPRAETEYFRIRCCQNGNLHIEFRRQDLLDRFNQLCGNERELPGRDEDPYQKPGEVCDDVTEVLRGFRPDSYPSQGLNWFATPDFLAEEMCAVAGDLEGALVLEPSAGEGAIADAAKEAGATVHCIELDAGRAEVLRNKGFSVQQEDFLDVAPPQELYDVVLMNPPFSGRRDLAHCLHAWRFLKPGGRLVCILSAGTRTRKDRMTVRFRGWVRRNGGGTTDVPTGTFSESGTEVSAVMLVMIKSG